MDTAGKSAAEITPCPPKKIQRIGRLKSSFIQTLTLKRSLVESGYDEDAINSLAFQSINVPSDGVFRLHIPMWRWEVDKEELEKYRVTFL
jgi:hypothetical protein